MIFGIVTKEGEFMEHIVKKDDKGITLIALIVTIIMLLILAGVSISMLTGQNGIINRAKQAKSKTRYATVKELVSIWKNERMLDLPNL